MRKGYLLMLLLIIGISNLVAQNALKRLGKRLINEINQQVEIQSESTEEQEVQEVKSSEPAAPQKDSLRSFSQYDFVPGDKILLFEDFSQEAVGDFPEGWTTDGSGEVKTLNIADGKWLHMNTIDKKYQVLKDLKLPDSYIIEFDIIVVPSEEVNPGGIVLSLYKSESSDAGFIDTNPTGLNVYMGNDQWLAKSYHHENGWVEGQSVLGIINRDIPEHIILCIQKRRLKIYHAGEKVLDLPTILPADFNPDRLMFDLWDTGGGTGYVTNLRITTTAADTRNKLLTEGKLISYGIYFDVNSDQVKPESYGTLKEIANIIKESSIQVQIVGHTDNSGNDAANLDLSKRRAASVKTELTKLGVPEEVLTTAGAGASQPIAPNDTPENKSLNRRSEFIKL